MMVVPSWEGPRRLPHATLFAQTRNESEPYRGTAITPDGFEGPLRFPRGPNYRQI